MIDGRLLTILGLSVCSGNAYVYQVNVKAKK